MIKSVMIGHCWMSLKSMPLVVLLIINIFNVLVLIRIKKEVESVKENLFFGVPNEKKNDDLYG